MSAAAAASKSTALAATSVALIAAFVIASPAAGVRPDKRDSETPSAPSNLRLTLATPFSLSVAWDAATDNVSVSGYYLYAADRQTDGKRTRVAKTTHTVQGLECGESVDLG